MVKCCHIITLFLCLNSFMHGNNDPNIPSNQYSANSLINLSYSELYPKAAKGDLAAQYAIGYKYETGQGLKLSPLDAMKWYRKSAMKGHAASQYRFGEMYLSKNKTQALKWIQKAAENGNIEAQLRLGHLYLWNNIGITCNNETAFKWFLMAAQQGNTEAQILIGDAYQGGEWGIDINQKEAEKWYLKAAESGNPEAMCRLGMNYLDMGNEIKAIECFEKTADQGNIESISQLAHLYCHTGNSKEAIRWYKKLAEYDSLNASSNLFRQYIYDGPEQNYQEAMKWGIKATKDGDTEIPAIIGLMYANGIGIDKNPVEAKKWFLKVEEGGDSNVLFDLGLSYSLGSFAGYNFKIEKDPENALRWIQKASELKSSSAMYYLGQSYLQGRGVKKDPHKAYAYFSESVNSGQAVQGSYYALGMMSLNGQVVRQDIVEAYKWFVVGSMAASGMIDPGLMANPDHSLTQLLTLKGEYVPKFMEKMAEIESTMTQDQIAQANERVEKYVQAMRKLYGKNAQ